jgi:hypothetical protein
MANPIGSKYLYQNAVLKELARPSSELATPSLEAPAMEYAEGRSLAEAAEAKLAGDIALEKASMAESEREFTASLAEKQRQFMSNLLFGQEQLGEFSKNNDLATLIGIGNIATQGVAAYQQNSKMEEQNVLLQDIAKQYAALPDAVSKAAAAERKKWETEVNKTPQVKTQKAPTWETI